MTDIASKIAEKFPDLLVMVFLVWMFLRAMKERDVALKERDTLFVAAIRQISEQHIEAREESRKVIAENSVHTINATAAMAAMTEALHASEFRAAGGGTQQKG